jgi:16S rRNA (guanine966-N2)-methyltransferase
MRIISGTFRGKKILEPKDIRTRPLKDLTKESIFNIINHSKKFKINLEDSNILDLFSGVGSFGIECLSRKVKKVTFIENYNGVLPILKKNLFNLKLINNYQIIEKDIYDKYLFLKLENKFDIIFLDPPFKDKNLDQILLNIKDNKILDKNGIIIVHRHKTEENILQEYFRIIEEKKYGISKIIFLSNLD